MKWLCVDPGEDTGWSYWDDEQLLEAGTEKMWTFFDFVWAATNDVEELPFGNFDLLVCEDFRLYPWKAKELAFDEIRTARLIGGLKGICRIQGKQFVLQPAKIKERAEAAGAEELFLKPLHENRHANDSIRHGVYYTAVTKYGVLEAEVETI